MLCHHCTRQAQLTGFVLKMAEAAAANNEIYMHVCMCVCAKVKINAGIFVHNVKDAHFQNSFTMLSCLFSLN